MSTPIKRIEKDFLLKVAYDEQIPVMYYRNRTEYIFTVVKPVGDEMVLRPNSPIEDLHTNKKMDLLFDYRGQMITFSVKVHSVKDRDNLIIVVAPEFLYKNLDRSFSRVQIPSDLQVEFIFSGESHLLSTPKVSGHESADLGDFVQNLDPKNLNVLLAQMSSWIKGYADGHRLVIFKDTRPAATEEKMIAKTAKTLFLPSTLKPFPKSDPYPKGRLITEEIFYQYLVSMGADTDSLDKAYDNFIKAKSASGVSSDLWVPLLFQEYVIGYIHLWIDKENKPPFDYGIIDTIYQFAAVLIDSLEINGYFKSGKYKKESLSGKVIDISVSGLLFVYPQSALVDFLLLDTELPLKLITEQRTLNIKGRIVRRYNDTTQWYFGVSFIDMESADIRFFFEYIYGKPFTDLDAVFLSGQV
jgi:hypothetical protein